jgi:hypothetical protein
MRDGAPSGSTIAWARSRARPGCGWTPGVRRRAWPPTPPPTCPPAPRRLVVDCGGDLCVAVASGAAPFEIAVAHPLTGARAATLRVAGGGVATSGLARRLWRGPDGRPAHHLLDPATGEPAWTGLISATAVAPTTLEAEALAKAALLRGPAGARRVLRRRGGVLVHDDGAVEPVEARVRRQACSTTTTGALGATA